MQEFAAGEICDVLCDLQRLVEPTFSQSSPVQWHCDDQGTAQVQTPRKRSGKPWREFKAVVKFERLDDPVQRKFVSPGGKSSTEMRRLRQTPAAYQLPWAGQSANGASLLNDRQFLDTAITYGMLRAGTGTEQTVLREQFAAKLGQIGANHVGVLPRPAAVPGMRPDI